MAAIKIINDPDVFLLGVRNVGGYENQRVTYQTLAENLRFETATQETKTKQGIPGTMFPDETFRYDKQSGRLSVNVDSRGLEFIDFISKGNGGFSDPLTPSLTAQTGDFYIVNDHDVVLNSTWGIEGSDLQINTTGSGFQSNDGEILYNNFDDKANPNTPIVTTTQITYTVERGQLIKAEAKSDDNQGVDVANEFEIGTLYYPHFKGALQGKFDDEPIIKCKNIYPGNNSVEFDIVSTGSEILLGPTFSNEGQTKLLGVKATPQDPDAYNRALTVDFTIENGELLKIDAHDYQFGAENGTKFNAISPEGDIAVLQLGGVNNAPVALNDKIVLTKSGWAVLPDTASREAVFDVTHRTHKPDGINEEDITPALQIDTAFLDTEGNSKVIKLSIDEASSGNSGLMPGDMYDKVASLPEYVSEICGIYPNYISTADQDINGTGTVYPPPPNFNPELDNKILPSQNNISIKFDEDKDCELLISALRTYKTVQDPVNSIEAEERVDGTVYIIKDDEIDNAVDNSLDLTQPLFYAAVPNADILTRRYAQIDAEEYTPSSIDIKQVKIMGANNVAEGGSIPLVASVISTKLSTAVENLTYKWSRDGAEDTSVVSNLYSVDNLQIADGVTEISCEVLGVTTTHYVSAYPS